MYIEIKHWRALLETWDLSFSCQCFLLFQLFWETCSISLIEPHMTKAPQGFWKENSDLRYSGESRRSTPPSEFIPKEINAPIYFQSGVPSLWNLMPDNLTWSWCINNGNKVHNKCIVLKSPPNHPHPTPAFHEIGPWSERSWGPPL